MDNNVVLRIYRRNLPPMDVKVDQIQQGPWDEIFRVEIWDKGLCIVAFATEQIKTKAWIEKRLGQKVAYIDAEVLNALGPPFQFKAALTASNTFSDLDIAGKDLVRSNGKLEDGTILEVAALHTQLPLVRQNNKRGVIEDFLNFKNASEEFSIEIDSKIGSADPNEFPALTISRAISPDENDGRSAELPELNLNIDPGDSVMCTQRPSLAWLNGGKEVGICLEFALTTSQVSEIWYQTISTPYHTAITTVRAGSPLSFLPVLRAVTDGGIEPAWVALYLFNDFSHLRALTLQPVEECTVALRFEKALSHSKHPLEYSCKLQARNALKSSREIEKRALEIQNERAPGAVIVAFETFSESLLSMSEPQVSRLGALDLHFADKFAATVKNVSFCEIQMLNGIPRATIEWHLPLLDFIPGGQDEVPSAAIVNSQLNEIDRIREKPIVTVLRKQNSAVPVIGVARFSMKVREENLSPSNQFVNINLSDVRVKSNNDGNNSDEPKKVIVIDRQPFFVGMVNFKNYYGNDLRDITSELGNWSSASTDGASWELHAGAEEFELILPPQAIGEAFEKFNQSKHSDVDEGKTADFRFSNLFRAILMPTYYKQRYVEAAWNTRRLFGYPGQRAPGAGITSLFFELLYGVGCTITQKGMRLAELFSRVGHIQIPPTEITEPGYTKDQIDRFEEYRERNWKLYSSLLHRLTVLAPGKEDNLEELTINSDLQFALRKEADLQYPILNKDPRNSNIPNKPKGLAGSYPWAFDSQNDYEELWQEPKTQVGEVHGINFSPLGAWGSQRALFAHEKLTLSSTATMGRTHSFTKERVGRIGCFWNRAKHVVVFERTTERPAQFPSQDPHAGRPIVRKVREYIELLEPIRRFPEKGAALMARGCILAIDFRSKIINVDSEWLQDVGEEGYQIPLWKEVAGMQEIYPKPGIFLEIAIDPEGGAASETRAIGCPEDLYFFASTVEKTANTDLWAPVAGVDYSLCPKPASSPIDYLGEPPVAPGFGRFTYCLERSEKKANFVVDRTSKSLGAVIQNVTMVRHLIASDNPLGVIRNMMMAKDELKNAVALIATASKDKGANLSEGFKALEQKPLASLKTSLEIVRSKVEEQNDALILELKREVRTRISKYFSELVTEGEGEYLHLVSSYTLMLRQIDQRIQALESYSEQKKTELEAEIDKFTVVAKNAITKCQPSIALIADCLTMLQSKIPITELQQIRKNLNDAAIPTTEPARQKLVREVEKAFNEIHACVEETSKTIEKGLSGWISTSNSAITYELSRVCSATNVKLSKCLTNLVNVALNKPADIDKIRKDAIAEIDKFIADANSINAKLNQLKGELQSAVSVEQKAIVDLLDANAAKVKAVIDASVSLTDLKTKCKAKIEEIGLPAVLGDIEHKILAFATKTEDTAIAKIQALIPDLKSIADDLVQGSGLESIKSAIESNAPLDFIDSLAKKVESAFSNDLKLLENRLLPSLKDEFKQRIPREANTAIKLIRLLGDTPKVPQLEFKYAMEKLPPAMAPIGYFFDPDIAQVSTTAVKGLLDHVEDSVRTSLKPVGLSLPTDKMLDQFLPDIREFKGLASDVLKDLGALPFDKLFPSLKIPSPLAEHVRVSHQLDKQTMRATAKAEISFYSKEAATLFSAGPITIVIDRANIEASIILEADASGTTSRKSKGKVSGDWRLNIGGTDFVTFKDTSLSFNESGKLNFNISPSKVSYSGALKFVTDLLANSGLSDSGSGLRIIPAPLKVVSFLDLPIPDLQMPGFAISNLRLGVSLWLGLSGTDFVIGVSANLATKMAPFSITIYLLCGGGWLEFSAEYVIGKRPSAKLSLGITAGAAFAINLSVIKGGVFVMFGITVEYASGDDNSLTIGIMLLISGHVSVMGIIDASITLLLEAQYTSDGKITAHGVLSIRIKICWCFTLSVHKEITYVLKKGEKTKVTANDRYAVAANSHINSMA